MKKLISSLIIIVFLASCSSGPVAVVVDKIDLTTGKITIDGKEQYTFRDSVITLQLKPGKHSIALNSEPAKNFTVGDNGGLINLDNQEYVAFEIEYAAQRGKDDFTTNSMRVFGITMIDSFLIVPKGGFGDYPDSSLRKLIPKLKENKNGNFFVGENDYDTDKSIQGVKKFGKDELYIESFWDFNLGEEIPETVTIQTKKNSYSLGTPSTTRTSVAQARLFLLMARLSPDQYTVKSINEIESGKEDKAKEELQEKSQMKF